MQKPLPEFIDSIRDLLAESETDQAIRELQQFLESDHKYHNLLAWVVSVSAEHHRLERNARRSLISDDDLGVGRNRINDQLLQIMRHLLEGDLDPDDAPKPVRRKRNWILPLLVLILIAGLGYVGWGYFLRDNNNGDGPTNSRGCPEFTSGSQFNVLLFPFRVVGGGSNLNPEVSIQQRLDKLCIDNNIRSSIRIHENYRRSLDYQSATQEGAKCQAGLVVWGTVEKHNDLTDLTTRYKYLGDAAGLEVTKLQLEGEAQVDATTSISSIVRQGVLTKNIEELILTIFGLIAHQEKRYDVAVEALEGATRSDTSGAILTGVLLADAYLALQDQNRALQAYDRVLEVHPEYPLALNNRATLQYMQGNFQKAVQDYSQIIAVDPDNVDALAGRSAAYTRMQQLDKAKIDLDNLRRISPDRLAPMHDNLQLLQQPKFFTEATTFLGAPAAKEFSFPAEKEAGFTQVFAGVIPDGQSVQSHLITVLPANGNYYFRFRATNSARAKKTWKSTRGQTYALGPNDINEKMNLPRGKYKLVIERPNTSGPLYYEIEMTVNRL